MATSRISEVKAPQRLDTRRAHRCAFVSFLYFMLSSKPDAFSQNKPSHVGK